MVVFHFLNFIARSELLLSKIYCPSFFPLLFQIYGTQTFLGIILIASLAEQAPSLSVLGMERCHRRDHLHHLVYNLDTYGSES
jgi:hypothetical protein